MALDRIENLIEKYFNGETSIAEENELKVYFSSTNVAQHLEQYQPIFGYFSQAKTEQFKATIPIQNKNRKRIVWLSIAASIVVLFGIGTFMYNQTNDEIEFEGCNANDNPEVVLKETQKALDLVSQKINTGVVSIGYINEYNNSKNRIFKQ
jgi:hypothetical protein